MDAEPTSPTPLCTESHSITLGEKRPFSKELTSPEHAALETKDKSKSIKTFLPWLKKLSKDRPSHDSVVESSKVAETPVPAPFLSLFRLDHPTFLMGISSSSMQVFNSL